MQPFCMHACANMLQTRAAAWSGPGECSLPLRMRPLYLSHCIPCHILHVTVAVIADVSRIFAMMILRFSGILESNASYTRDSLSGLLCHCWLVKG
jgi:hypothetical protein